MQQDQAPKKKKKSRSRWAEQQRLRLEVHDLQELSTAIWMFQLHLAELLERKKESYFKCKDGNNAYKRKNKCPLARKRASMANLRKGTRLMKQLGERNAKVKALQKEKEAKEAEKRMRQEKLESIEDALQYVRRDMRVKERERLLKKYNLK